MKRILQLLLFLWLWGIPGFTADCIPSQEQFTLTWDSPNHAWKEGYRVVWRAVEDTVWHYPSPRTRTGRHLINSPNTKTANLHDWIDAPPGREIEVAVTALWCKNGECGLIRPFFNWRRDDKIWLKSFSTGPSDPVTICWPGG